MIKRLVVNGCSWTAGNELEHSPEFMTMIQQDGLHKQNPQDYNNWNLLNSNNEQVSTFDQYYNKLNWAGYLKDRFLAVEELINLSTGGGSNTRILRTTIDYVMSLPDHERSETLIAIGWTVSERSEIYVGNSWQRWNATQQFSTTVDRLSLNDDRLIKKLDKFQEGYIAYAHSDYEAVHRYFQQCYLLSNLLDNLKIPYVFFNALPAWWRAGPLKTNINPEDFSKYIVWQEQNKRVIANTTMFKFVNDGNYDVAPYKHPLAQAHLAWANYLHIQITERQLI